MKFPKGGVMSIEIKETVLYTTEELAEILHLNLITVQKMLKAGTLPGFKLGRRWYVLGRDLLAMRRQGQPDFSL
jgi:excisionase family DNA binding protein